MALDTHYGTAARQVGIPVRDVLTLIDEGKVDAVVGPWRDSRTLLIDVEDLKHLVDEG